MKVLANGVVSGESDGVGSYNQVGGGHVAKRRQGSRPFSRCTKNVQKRPNVSRGNVQYRILILTVLKIIVFYFPCCLVGAFLIIFFLDIFV